MSLEELLEQFDEALDGGIKIPGKKTLVDIEKLRAVVDEIRLNIPAEIKQAKGIVADRADIITNAKREADAIRKAAHAEAKELVTREAIYQEAKEQANEMIRNAQEKIKELKQVTMNYVDDSLRETEEAIAQALAEVRDSRAKFSAVVNPKPVVRNSVIIEDV